MRNNTGPVRARSSHTRDVASAEDALSGALVAALTTWPRDIPRTATALPPEPPQSSGTVPVSCPAALLSQFWKGGVEMTNEDLLKVIEAQDPRARAGRRRRRAAPREPDSRARR